MREFPDLASFLVQLVEVEMAIRTGEHEMLDRAAKVIEADAKDRIGAYQDEVAPFAAWAPLAPATIDDRVRQGYTPNDPLLRSGELRDSISHEVEGTEAVVGSTSPIAVYQELGTSTIPPRPFIGPAALATKDRVEKIIGEAAVSAFEYGAVGAFTDMPK